MKENKMGVEPINKLLITMSLPMIISMIVQALYNIVDSIFIGRYDLNALTAVSLAFPYQNLMIAVASGTAVGMNALLSKSLGEKNYETANYAAGNGLVLMMVSSLIFVFTGVFFSEFYFSVQNPNPQIIEYGKQYLMICSGFCFAVFGQFIFERMLQSTGKTVYAMISQGVGAIINIIFDPILIFGLFGFPRLGVAGAALATIFGQIIAMLIACFFNYRFNEYISLKPKYMKLDSKTVKTIYSVGVPSILMVSIGSVMTFSLNKILCGFDNIKTVYGNNTGTLAATVLGIYFKLQSFIFMPVFGLNNGMVPIVAYNYGAKNRERIKATMKLSIIYAMSIMIIGFFVFQIFPDKLIFLFNQDESLLSIGIVALRIISISFIFAGFCIICGSVFQATGKPHYSLGVSIAGQLVFLLPLAYIFSLTKNIDMVWLAFPLSELISVTMSTFYIKRLFKSFKF